MKILAMLVAALALAGCGRQCVTSMDPEPLDIVFEGCYADDTIIASIDGSFLFRIDSLQCGAIIALVAERRLQLRPGPHSLSLQMPARGVRVDTTFCHPVSGRCIYVSYAMGKLTLEITNDVHRYAQQRCLDGDTRAAGTRLLPRGSGATTAIGAAAARGGDVQERCAITASASPESATVVR